MVWSPVATQRLSQVRPVDRHGRPDDVDLLEDDDFLELFGSRIDTDAPRSPGALSSSPSCAATEPVDDSASKRPPCSPCVASPLKEQEEKRPKRVTKPTSKILSQISRVIVAAAAAEAKANKVDAVKKRNEHRPARVYPPPVPRQILSSDALSARPPPPPARPAPAAAYRVLFPAGTESAAVDAFEKELPARLPAHIVRFLHARSCSPFCAPHATARCNMLPRRLRVLHLSLLPVLPPPNVLQRSLTLFLRAMLRVLHLSLLPVLPPSNVLRRSLTLFLLPFRRLLLARPFTSLRTTSTHLFSNTGTTR
mmetsp:Transcript_6549/g.23241  ORF Transcript_6549/g.23241 Transcript_6549/m.23241 type:complete len:309 (+) Transcript_6549:297-1223(+)